MIVLLVNAARRLLWSAAAVLFGVLLYSLTRIPNVPLVVAAALFVMAGVAAWMPAPALTAVVLLVPVASWLGRTWNGAVAWPEAVALAFLAGYACRYALSRRHASEVVVAVAIETTIAVVVASIGVQILLLNSTVGFAALNSRLAEMLTLEYFIGQVGFEGTHAGMRLIEGLLLAHASLSVTRANPRFGPLVLKTAVIAAAIASSLNLLRVWQGAARTDSPVSTFFHYLATIRFNTHYGDVNAAGSYFAMTVLAALGLAREASPWRWGAFAGFIALSLILSGSRTAIAAAVPAALFVWWLNSKEGNQRLPLKRTTKIAAGVVVTICMAATYLLLVRNDTPSSIALRIRAEFAAVSLRMLYTRPLFGVGVGQFPARLQEFASTGLMEVYPKTQENAHNNFLQILAELGLVGFAAFMWVLLAAARAILPLLRKVPSSPVHLHLSAGLLTFVLTWLGGHPLLIDAPAFTFWLLLGAAAGFGPAPAAEHVPRHTRWVAAALVIATIASVPIRARQELGIANLEHMAIGLSRWQHGGDNVDYRMAGRASTVFIPSDAKVIALPLRAAQAGELRVDIYMEGRLVNALDVPSDAWRVLDLQVPRRDNGGRFRALELRIPGATTVEGQSLLMVGKLQPHW